MSQPGMAEGPGHGTINGVPFASTNIKLSINGRATRKKVDLGTLLVMLQGDATLTIDAPFMGNGHPIDVMDIVGRAAGVPVLLVIAWDNGSADTMYGALEGKEKSSGVDSGTDVSYSFIVVPPIEA